MSNVSFVQEKNTIYVIGDAALSLANMLKKTLRRPMEKGVISAGELEAERILLLLIKSVLGSPSVEDEVVYYSIPAKSIDTEMDVVYHEAIFKKMIESLGYKAYSINEAAAIVYACCSNQMFTALSTSFGSGMCNTALVYKTLVGMAFSTQQAGDWIDRSASRAVGSTETRLMTIKEKGVDLLHPEVGDHNTLREREAIVVYYKNLIRNVIYGVKKEFKKNNASIELPDSIPWVLSGGTVLPTNFLEFFKTIFNENKNDFPISISEIRISSNSPLNDVARGCLIAAMND
jgi:actin-like ATPase involved in cell morphogenesis